MKKKLWIPIACAALLLGGGLLAYSLFPRPAGYTYNENPDLSSKVVASQYGLPMLDRDPNPSFEQITYEFDCVAVAEVLDDGTQHKYDISKIEPGKPSIGYIDWETVQELGEDYFTPDKYNYGICTYSKLKIEKVIAGKAPESDVIDLFQLGFPGKNDSQTKVRKGDRIYIIMNKLFAPENLYGSNDLENTIFYLDENDRLTSMSNIDACTRYDGLPMEALTKDLMETEDYKERFGN